MIEKWKGILKQDMLYNNLPIQKIAKNVIAINS